MASTTTLVEEFTSLVNDLRGLAVDFGLEVKLLTFNLLFDCPLNCKGFFFAPAKLNKEVFGALGSPIATMVSHRIKGQGLDFLPELLAASLSHFDFLLFLLADASLVESLAVVYCAAGVRWWPI